MQSPRAHEKEVVALLRKQVRVAVRKTAREIQSAAQQNAPVRTGKLSRETKARTKKGNRIEVSSGAFYGRFLDRGEGRSRSFKGWLGEPVQAGAKELGKRLASIQFPKGKVIRP